MQCRHWANAMDIHLEAIHAWKWADYVPNRIKRSEGDIDSKVLEKCLAEAAVDIERDDDIEALGPDLQRVDPRREDEIPLRVFNR